MSETIAGISVKIGADTKEFVKGCKAMDKQISATSRQVNELQKGLRLEWDNGRFLQAQKLAAKALGDTEGKAEALRKQLNYLETSGADTTAASYRNLQTELIKTENEAVKLRAKLDEVNSLKFEHIGGQIEKIGQGLSNAGRALAPISALAAGAAVGLGKLAVDTAAAGAAIDDTSLRLGISAEKVQELQYVTTQCGVEWNMFEKGLIRARAALLDLSSGKVNEQAKAIQALGISAGQFGNNEEMFDGIIDALANMTDKTQQAALANEIFGDKIAHQMLPFLNAGTVEINKFKEEFSAFDSLTNAQVAGLAKLDDMIFRLKEAIRNITQQLGASLVPIATAFVQFLEDKAVPAIERVSNWFKELDLSQQKTLFTVLALIAGLAPLLMVLGKVTTGIGGIIKIIPSLLSAFSALAAHPVIAIIGVIAVLFGILYAKNEMFRNSINKLVQTIGKVLAPILQVVTNLFGNILGLLMPIVDILGNVLGSVIEGLIIMLQPFIDILVFVVDLIDKILNGIMVLFGKGWLWGRGEEKQEKPNYGGGYSAVGGYDTQSEGKDLALNQYTDYVLPGTQNANTTNSSTVNDYSNIQITINQANEKTTDEIMKEINKQYTAKKLSYR